MTAVASLLPPDVQVEPAEQGALLRILYVYGDGGMWKLDVAACRQWLDSSWMRWQTVARELKARKSVHGPSWRGLPDGVACGESGRPYAARNDVAVVSYDHEDLIREAARSVVRRDDVERAAKRARGEDLSSQDRTALAFVDITGNWPKGLHGSTLSRLHNLVQHGSIEDPNGALRFYELRPEVRAVAEATPLHAAYRKLSAAGYKWAGWWHGGVQIKRKYIGARILTFTKNTQEDGRELRLDATLWGDGTAYWSFAAIDRETGKRPRFTRGEVAGNALPEGWR